MDPRVATVLHLIRRNPRTRLRDLAAAVHLSPSRLQHLFTRDARVSIRTFSQQHVLSHAARLLTESGLSVKEVRAVVGFEDPSAFCRAFKKHYGLCPPAFRRAGHATPTHCDAHQEIQ